MSSARDNNMFGSVETNEFARKWLVLLFAVLIAGPVEAATYYVAPDGSDATECARAQALSTPKQTISDALACLAAGDTLYIRGGIYSEFLGMHGWPGGAQGTSWETATTIKAYQGERVSIQPPRGSDFVLDLRGSSSGSMDAPRYLIFDGLIFDGRNGVNYEIVKITAWDPTRNPANAPAHHIRIANSEIIGLLGSGSSTGSSSGVLITWGSVGVQIINTEIHHVGSTGPVGNTGACIYGAASDLLVDGVHCHHSAGYGISNVNSYPGLDTTNHIVRNSIVHDAGQISGSAQGGGINEGEGSGHQIYNNLAYNNPGPGIAIAWGQGASGTQVYNNTVYNNGGGGVVINPGQIGTIVRNNVAYKNSGGNFVNNGSGTISSHNSFDGDDPQFINAAAADFRLQSTSPLVDVAAAIPTLTTDLSGVRRPQGFGYDIGALERPAGEAPASPSGLRIVE